MSFQPAVNTLSAAWGSFQILASATGDTLPDVVEGDVLVHGGTEYRIDHVAEWPDLSGGVPSLQIVVTTVKASWATVSA